MFYDQYRYFYNDKLQGKFKDIEKKFTQYYWIHWANDLCYIYLMELIKLWCHTKFTGVAYYNC